MPRALDPPTRTPAALPLHLPGSPRRRRLDTRVSAVSKKAKVPPVPDLGDGKKHEWAEVVHKNTVTWLAKWKDSINGEDKCVHSTRTQLSSSPRPPGLTPP